jgi:biopolymer transport protein ExbB
MSPGIGGHDLTPWGMYQAADWVVQGVLIALVLASVLTWTIWFAKSLELLAAKMRIRTGLRQLRTATSLVEAPHGHRGSSDPVSDMLTEARQELELSATIMASDAVRERIIMKLQRIEATYARRINRGVGMLAIIGSTAPFVGLFGTVWGIMNSFIAIAKQNTTNLSVVAPGIAEALLATAVGLAAAIPAVVIYNLFARSTATYRALLTDAATDVVRLASRDQDKIRHGTSAQA